MAMKQNQNGISVWKGYLTRVKIAVAMAVIQNKPKGVTGKEFAEVLVQDYQTSQLEWKAQYERLLDQVQQERSDIEQLQQFNATESMPGPQPADTTFSQNLFPTPTNSSEEHQTKLTPPSEKRAKHCIQFLQALLDMRNIASQGQGGICSTEDSKAEVEQIVNQSVQILAEWTLDASMPLSDTMADQVVETLVAACDCDCDRHIKECSIGAMCIFIQDLIKTIMDHKKFCQVAIQKKRATVLSSLCRSRSLRPSLIVCYIHCISQYAKVLKQVQSEEVQFEPHLYENIYFIFTCLDELVQAEIKMPEDERALSQEEVMDSKEQLEQCSLNVTDAFTLFSHFVYRSIDLLQLLHDG